MSYKIEVTDEYSYGQSFSPDLRFETEDEAESLSSRLNWAWNGIRNVRIVPSDDPVNARCTKNGLADKDGNAFFPPAPFPSAEEIRQEAKRLNEAWQAIVDSNGQFWKAFLI